MSYITKFGCSVYSFVYYNLLLPAIQTGNKTNYILLGSLAIISLIGIIILRKKHNEKYIKVSIFVINMIAMKT